MKLDEHRKMYPNFERVSAGFLLVWIFFYTFDLGGEVDSFVRSVIVIHVRVLYKYRKAHTPFSLSMFPFFFHCLLYKVPAWRLCKCTV